MSHPTITLTPRATKGTRNAVELRAKGLVPCIVYGHNKERQPEMFALEEATFKRQLDAGHKLFKLKSEKGEEQAMVAEIQIDEVSDLLIHVDFQRVSEKDTVVMKVPVHLTGTPEGAKAGGRLELFLHEIKVRTTPSALPPEVVIDVSKMNIFDRVALSDLTLPAGITAVGMPSTTVCMVHPPKKVEEVKPEAAAIPADGAAAPAAGDAPKAEGGKPGDKGAAKPADKGGDKADKGDKGGKEKKK